MIIDIIFMVSAAILFWINIGVFFETERKQNNKK